MPLFQPPDFTQVPESSSLLFLGGPIQGTSDWQGPTATWFLDRMPELYVASPRSGMWNRDLPQGERDRLYAEQTSWEHTYLDEAIARMKQHRVFASWGATIIMFWCAAEEEHIARRAYAQTSRFELGVTMGYFSEFFRQQAFGPSKIGTMPNEGVIIGADPKFSGRKYLEIYLRNHGRSLYDSLEATRAEVLQFLSEF